MSIAVCTPTYNRRWTWEWSRMCFDRQDYPADRLTWIIVDNSDADEQSWSISQTHPRVRYTRVEGKRAIGELRNLCIHEALKTNCDYIAFWDDDDFYVTHRFSHAIKCLQENREKAYVGCSLLYLLLVKENVLMKVGPYGENHSTAASWVMRRSHAEQNLFDPKATRGEEGKFMREWNTPMHMIRPEDCLLVMGHHVNTVNKSQVRQKSAQFMASDLNSANGKMVARMQWFQSPDVWAQFQSTFSVVSNGPPRVTT